MDRSGLIDGRHRLVKSCTWDRAGLYVGLHGGSVFACFPVAFVVHGKGARGQHMTNQFWRLAVLGGVLACGARTSLDLGLPLPEEDAAPSDAASSQDAFTFPKPTLDASIVFDAFPDVLVPPGCENTSLPAVYVITLESKLIAFDPPSLTFTEIGDVHCSTTATPMSLAVSRTGFGYSVFNDGNLFQIDTANAACQPTPFTPNQQGFDTFGMGYIEEDGGERLYVARNSLISGALGTIDTTSFVLSMIGQLAEHPCELTGTANGRLFGFCISQNYPVGPKLIEIDPATAKIISGTNLDAGSSATNFAFAFWGGVFWLFSGGLGTTTVTRYDPFKYPHEKVMTTFAGSVVGAGVSTCAPE